MLMLFFVVHPLLLVLFSPLAQIQESESVLGWLDQTVSIRVLASTHADSAFFLWTLAGLGQRGQGQPRAWGEPNETVVCLFVG